MQDFSVTSDASGNVGFAAILGTHWFAQEWPCDAKDVDIAIKELIPICIAAVVWKHHWSRKRIKFRSDNSSVVACLRSGLCCDRHMDFLLCELSISATVSSFTFTAVYILGKFNQPADALSRCQF